MKTLNRTLPLLLVMLLSACASFKLPSATAPASTQQSAADNDGSNVADTDPRLPRVELTPDIVYGVVAGEIAAQRGAVGSSALTYLDLAKQTRDPRMAQRAAELGLFSGQLKVASDALELWVELDPSSQTAREQLFIVLLRSGKLAESQPLVEDLLTREPERARAIFVQLARLTSLQSDKQGAYQLVSQLAERYPDLPEARFALIAVAAEVGDNATIQHEFDRLAVIAPKWDLPVAWQTDRLRHQSNAQALSFLQQELARRPQASLELKMAYPRLLVSSRQFEQSRIEFEKLLKDNPTNPDLLYGAGLLAFQFRDFAVAQRDLVAALNQHHPEADFIRFTLGQIAEEQGDTSQALNWYEMVGAGQQFLAAQARIALIDAEAGKLDQALARLATLGSTEDEKIQLVLLQSQIARSSKQPARAYELLSKAVQQHPKSPDLLYERALVSDSLGHAVNAERDLRLVLKAKPNDPQVLNALGYTLANRTTRYQEALGYINRALKAEPANPMILDSLGWVQFKLGHLAAARQALEQSYAKLPDAEVAAHLGEVLWQQGHKDEARQLWDNALRAHPGHEVLLDTLRRHPQP